MNPTPAPVPGGEWCDLLGGLANRIGGSEFVDSIVPFVRRALASGAIDPQAQTGDGSLLLAATLMAGRVRAQQSWIRPDRGGTMTALCPASEALAKSQAQAAASRAEALVLALLAAGAKPDEHLDDVLAGHWPLLAAGGVSATLMALPEARKWGPGRGMDGAWASPWVLAMHFGLTQALSAMLCLLPREAVAAARTHDGTPWAAALLGAGHEDCARLLFIAGADPNACDARGRGVVSYARSAGAIALLSEFGGVLENFVGDNQVPPWEDWRRAGVSVADIASMRAAMPNAAAVRETPADKIAAGQWPALRQAFGTHPHAEMAWTLATVMARPGNMLFRNGLAKTLKAAGPFPAGEHGAESLLRCAMAVEALRGARHGSTRDRLAFCRRLCALAGAAMGGVFVLSPTSADKGGPLLAAIEDAEARREAARHGGQFARMQAESSFAESGTQPVTNELRKEIAAPGRLLDAARLFAVRAGEAGQDPGVLAALARNLMAGSALLADGDEAATVIRTLIDALPQVLGGETLLLSDDMARTITLRTGTGDNVSYFAGVVPHMPPDLAMDCLRRVSALASSGGPIGGEAGGEPMVRGAVHFVDALAAAAARWPGLTRAQAVEACELLDAIAGLPGAGGIPSVLLRKHCNDAGQVIAAAGVATDLRAGGERRPRHRS